MMASIRSFQDMTTGMTMLSPLYNEAMVGAIRDSGLPNYFDLHVIKGAEPEDFTLERYHRYIYPYAKKEHLAKALDVLVETGFVEKDAAVYRVTEKGDTTIKQVFAQAAHAFKAGDALLPRQDLERLRDLLRAVVQFNLATDEVKQKVSIGYSRWTQPADDAPIVAHIDQYLADLYAWRDDCHLQAWTPYMAVFGDGLGYEAFNFVWTGEATTVDGYFKMRPNRGYDADEVRAALDAFLGKGLLEKEGDDYRVTNRGKALRASIEAETERLYALGFAALSREDLAELEAHFAAFLKAARRYAAVACAEQVEQIGDHLYTLMREGRVAVAEAEGYPEGTWHLLYKALIYNPVTRAKLQHRNPYRSHDDFESVFDEQVAKGGLEKQGDGYVVTKAGRSALEKIFQAVYDAFNAVEGLPEGRLAGLYDHLLKVVTAAKAAYFRTDILQATARTEPSAGSNTLAWIDQCMDELHAFRDDAHLAAWREEDIDGQSLETLTFLWRGEIRTAADMAEKRGQIRRLTEADYEAAFQRLAAKGWVEAAGDGYQITAAGQALRDAIEARTDDYYFAAWEHIDQHLVGTFLALVALRNALAAAVAAQEAPAAA